jgi:DNA-binding transcriptional MerR regulator
MIKHYFSTSDLVRLSKLSAHMVAYLCRCGILAPTLSTERRRGLKRRFAYADLLLARAINTLLLSGVSIASLGRALRTLRRKFGALPAAALGSKRVLIVGNSVYLLDDGDGMVDLTSNGQLAFHFVIDTSGIPKEAVSAAQSRNRRRSA